VGLKQFGFQGFYTQTFAPQSNQRGIETTPKGPAEGRPIPRLNRTSVGLKQADRAKAMEAARASIEPAWD